LAALAQELSAMLGDAQGSGAKIARLALVGNGARLPGLAERVEQCTGVSVELPVAALLRTSEISDEILRVASPDWTLAAALSGWAAA
jgi:Tfp pilus assembly PilM family ATPase